MIKVWFWEVWVRELLECFEVLRIVIVKFFGELGLIEDLGRDL